MLAQLRPAVRADAPVVEGLAPWGRVRDSWVSDRVDRDGNRRRDGEGFPERTHRLNGVGTALGFAEHANQVAFAIDDHVDRDAILAYAL